MLGGLRPLFGMADVTPAARKAIERLLDACDRSDQNYYDVKLKELAEGRALLAATPTEQLDIATAAIAQYIKASGGYFRIGRFTAKQRQYAHLHILPGLIGQLLSRKLPFTEANFIQLLALLKSGWDRFVWYRPDKAIIGAIERTYHDTVTPPSLQAPLKSIRKRYTGGIFGSPTAEERALMRRIDALLGITERAPILEAIEDWSRQIQNDLKAMNQGAQAKWETLMRHAATASASRPTKKWLTTADTLMTALPDQDFEARFIDWCEAIFMEDYKSLPLAGDLDSTLIKGLVWCASTASSEPIELAIRTLAHYAFRKVPDYGAGSVKIGNACVYALGALPGLRSVSMLNELLQKVRYPSARKLIEKALEDAARANNMSRVDLDELAVPDFGLKDGRLAQDFGEVRGLMTLEGGKTALSWIKADGKAQKTPPRDIANQHTVAIKAWKKQAKEIETTYETQARRIEGMYLADRHLPFGDFKKRFLDHALVGLIAQRLIWQFSTGDQHTSGLWHDDRFIDAAGKALQDIEDSEVRLWHPISESAEGVRAWRTRLETLGITQPFKQAHREVYLITDAERETLVYSNRFAAHVLKQHQMAALAQSRGWSYYLQGAFDSHNTPTRELPHFGLRIEYYVDGIGVEDNDESLLSGAGICLYVATDQVRFTRDDEHGPIALESIPPIAFSEAMRDVDLFVGVASVGNDPQWADRGIDGYHDYWQSFAFGELGASAKTRREVLERLLPRLRIADRCTLDERFLVVKGRIRSYRIHLGSTNILMAPNDEYLCIVESRAHQDTRDGKLFLPFEGDHGLAVILSKAFMLADDDKITDRSILSQIKRG